MKHDCSVELREAQLKITPARVETMRLLKTHDKPIDAQHIITHLQKTLGIDRVTVFRILNTFTEKGLVRKLEFGEGKARYELSDTEHHHFICERCGLVEDVPDCVVNESMQEIEERKGVFITRHSLEFFGLCKSCVRRVN